MALRREATAAMGLTEQLLQRIQELEEWRRTLVLPEMPVTAFSDDDTATPPTQAQLVTAFGSAADRGAGYFAFLDDNGDNVRFYLVASNGVRWWYVALTAPA